jgi:hypothetical protein
MLRKIADFAKSMLWRCCGSTGTTGKARARAEPISELDAGFVHVKASPRARPKTLAELVDANDRRSGLYSELTVDGGRGFAPPFLHRRKADPTARPCPLPGTLTFFGTVLMVA